MDFKNVISQAGDYTLETVEIVSYRREAESGELYRMNIKPITVNVEVTEDIFSNYILGRLTVIDAQDIRTILPITGLERLNLKFSTPGLPGYNAVEDEGHPFQIYKIEAVTQDASNMRMQAYDIHFCSQEMYFNNIHRVSRAYAGPTELAVDDIFHNKNYLNSKKRLSYEPSRTNDKVVIPNLKPINAINFLSGRTMSAKYKNAGYLFYETSQGYFYRSIESMLAMNGAAVRPAKFAYRYQVSNVVTNKQGVRDVNTDMRNVINYEFKKPVNVLNNLIDGMIANRLIRHDAFDKTVKTTDYNYFEDFGKNFHLEHNDTARTHVKSMLPFVNFEDTNTDLSSNPLAKLMMVANTSKIHNDYDGPLKSETVQQIISQRTQYTSTEMNLHVFGNTLLNAGDIINFNVPVMRPIGSNKTQEISPYWNGRYLITSLKHIINIQAGRHEMILKCSKDSIRTPYPIEKDNMEVNKPDAKVSDIYSLDEGILQNG